jgi:hypothetical protein
MKKIPKLKKEPDFLCNWDFCSSCIAYRKLHKIKPPKLKPHPHAKKES